MIVSTLSGKRIGLLRRLPVYKSLQYHIGNAIDLFHSHFGGIVAFLFEFLRNRKVSLEGGLLSKKALVIIGS